MPASSPTASRAAGQYRLVNDVALGDVDGDGDLDAFVANGTFGGKRQPPTVWLNNGARRRFSDSGQSTWEPGSDSAGRSPGRLDGDGDLDAFVANRLRHGSNRGVDQRRGARRNSRRFTDSGQTPLGIPIAEARALGDVDGDGDLDAFVANSTGNQANQGVDQRRHGASFTDSGQSLGNLRSNSSAVRWATWTATATWTPSDILVSEVDLFTLISGVESIRFADDDANVQVSATNSKTFWITLLTNNASGSPCLQFDS